VAIINGSSTTSALLPLPAKISLKAFEGIVISSPEKRSLTAIRYGDATVWDQDQKLHTGDGLVVILKPSQVIPK
jgi:hypothetical protein